MKFDREVGDFIRFIGTQVGAQWHLRHIWSAADGWRVEWRCNDRHLRLDPLVARKLSRYLRSEFRRITFQAPPGQRDFTKDAEMARWADSMDTKGKEALLNNRNKVVPEGAPLA